MDRRLLLVVNTTSLLCANLFMVLLGTSSLIRPILVNALYILPVSLYGHVHDIYPAFVREHKVIDTQEPKVLVPNIDLKLLWLAGLFSLFGGGAPVFSTLLRSIIAESVMKDKL